MFRQCLPSRAICCRLSLHSSQTWALLYRLHPASKCLRKAARYELKRDYPKRIGILVRLEKDVTDLVQAHPCDIVRAAETEMLILATNEKKELNTLSKVAKKNLGIAAELPVHILPGSLIPLEGSPAETDDVNMTSRDIRRILGAGSPHAKRPVPKDLQTTVAIQDAETALGTLEAPRDVILETTCFS
jgi:hypothetical protein